MSAASGWRLAWVLIAKKPLKGERYEENCDSDWDRLADAGSPSIGAGGVISAGAFGAFTSVAPGSWIEIYGSNLAADSRSWAGSDFNGVNAATSLDGTKVTVGGQPAFIDYI